MMKQKWLALLACLALLVCMIPMTVAAEGEADAPIEVEVVVGGDVYIAPDEYFSDEDRDSLASPCEEKWERSIDGGEQWETILEDSEQSRDFVPYFTTVLSEAMDGLLYRYTITDAEGTILTCTVKLKVVPMSFDNVKATLTLPATVDGVFTQADIDAGGIRGEGVPQHMYKVTLTAGETLEVTMRGVDNNGIDSYLYLLNAAGTQVAFDDDGSGGYDSRIQYTAWKGGDYYIVATAFDADVFDGITYALTAALSDAQEEEEVQLQPEVTLTPGQSTTISGTITEDNVDYDGDYAVLFPVKLEAGDILVLDNVTDGIGVWMYTEKNAGANDTIRNYNDLFWQVGFAGVYYLDLYTLDETQIPEEGLGVSADVRVIRTSTAAEVTLTLPYTGKLEAREDAFAYSEGDAAWLVERFGEDAYAYMTSGNFYQVEVPAGGVLSIGGASDDVAPLEIYNGDKALDEGGAFEDMEILWKDAGEEPERLWTLHIPSKQAWTATIFVDSEAPMQQDISISFAPLLTADTDKPTDGEFTVGDELSFTLSPWGSDREHSQGSMMGIEEMGQNYSFVSRMGLVSYTITAPDGSVINGTDAQGTIDLTMPGKYTLTATLRVEASHEGLWQDMSDFYNIEPITLDVLEVQVKAAQTGDPSSDPSSTPEQPTPPTGVSTMVLPVALLAAAAGAALLLVTRKRTAAND